MGRGQKKKDTNHGNANRGRDPSTIGGRRRNRNVNSVYQRPVEEEQAAEEDEVLPENTAEEADAAETASQRSLAQSASARNGLRRQIEIACGMINNIIESRGSRRACRALVKKIDSMFEETERLNLIAVSPNDSDAYDEQVAIQLALFTAIETIKENVESFEEQLLEEPLSTYSFRTPSIRSEALQQSTRTHTTTVDSDDTRRQGLQRHIQQQIEETLRNLRLPTADDHQRLDDVLTGVRQQAAAANQHQRDQGELLEAQRRAEEAVQKVVRLQSQMERRNSAPTIISPGLHNWDAKEAAINDWRRRSFAESKPTIRDEEEAPDEWIVRYCNNEEEPNWTYSYKAPSTKTEMPIFSGRAIDWFSFIDRFRALAHDQRISPGEKLAALKSSLRGPELDIVEGLGGGEAAYKSALLRLKAFSGCRDVMRASYVTELNRLEPGRTSMTLRRFAEKVRTYLFELIRIGEPAPAQIIEQVVRKLHPSDRLDWNKEKGSGLERRSLDDFGRWLCERAAAYQNSYSRAEEQLTSNRPSDPRHRSSAYAHHIDSEPAYANHVDFTDEWSEKSSKPRPRSGCFFCNGEHRLVSCSTFKSKSVKDKIRFCIKKRLCLKCFGPGHHASECKSGKGCEVDGCPHNHHQMLHESKEDCEADAGDSNHTSLSARADQLEVALGVIHAEAFAADGSIIPVSIMVDEGSNTTLFREDLLRRLKLRGTTRTLDLFGVTGASSRHKSQRIDVRFRLPDGEETIIAGLSIPQVTRPTPVINWTELKRRWPHLQDVPVEKSGGKIDILLGLDHSHLLAVLESRVGGDDEPFASRTRLGWVIRGLLGDDIGPKTARVHHVTSSSADGPTAPEVSLATEFKKFCDTEAFGTEFKGEGLSESEKIAEKVVDEGLKKLEAGYETPLTWLEGEPAFENNRKLAEHRLQDLMERFKRDPELETDYHTAIKKYIDEGYASLVNDEDLHSNDQYYLPHHGVYKKVYGKKKKKLRVVFDAAARWKKKCLNDGMRRGRKLQNDLPKVLIRFRQGEIAFAADITAMYSRIRLRPNDARYHRFLWREPGSNKVLTYQMDRLPFGSNCAPFIALKTAQRAAADAKVGRTDCMEAVAQNMYMDDLLKAADNEEEAIQKAKNIRDGLAEGDFHLTNWISNSAAVVAALQPGKEKEPTSACDLASDDVEKLLGAFYEPTVDELTYRVSGEEEVDWTRAGLLSKVASVYDPLGLAAPLMVKAKIKLRELGTKGMAWKDRVTGEDKRWWQRWFRTLTKLNNVRTARNLQQDKMNIVRSELHTFCDASEEAYAAAVYQRNVYKDGTAKSQLVMAKTKLAPRKSLSIPKLELNAALLGARLSDYVAEALNIPGLIKFLWTDSSTTRNWLRAVAPNYTPFFSHRVGEIQLLTEASEWRFVPGKINIADVATRSFLIDGEAIPPGWLDGPAFLQQPSDSWPKDLPWMAVSEERRAVRAQHATVTTARHDWAKVVIDSSNLSSCLKMEEEFKTLVRHCQEEEFSEDIKRLARKQPLHRKSRLIQLSPFLDEDGIIRLGGRTRRAKLPYDVLHPPILPGRHPLAEKIVTAIHSDLHHVGTDFLHSKARQHFWVLQGRELAKRVRFGCKTCTQTRAKLATQKMGDLPSVRLDSHTAPFTHVALDYFGPLETSSYRGRVTKRYGLLITCLVTRYMYLDLTQSLSTPDFLYGFRRFVGEYSKPSDVYCDNGTNFVGAEKEMESAVKEFQQDQRLKEFAQSRSIVWKFQPPSAPHFGGSHEALVKSAKRALYRALDTEKAGLRYPTDEMLRTLLKEVAGLLNSRPLTLASNDPDDFRPLTPKDFLNLPPTSDLPAGDVSRALPRDHVRYVKKMALIFWDLWTKIYLPTLVPRRKWTQEERNFAVGDVVMLSEANLPPSQWRTGRVTTVFPGSDGFVRVARVKTESGNFLRPIHRLVLLEPVSVVKVSTSGENVPEEKD